MTAVRGTAPAAPRNLTATTTKSGIALTWVVPTSNGGSAITGSRLPRHDRRRDDVLRRRARRHRDDRHEGGEADEYFYRVTAVNVLGESVSSAEVNATSR